MTSAAQLAASNARLQAEVHARVVELTASRRRILDARDEERMRLERRLREGAQHRLEQLAPSEGPLGVRVGKALASLAEGFPVRVELKVTTDRTSPPVEAAAYFVCAEALANVAKYASASTVTMSVTAHDSGVAVIVEDDGVGGADAARGSGLRGLADRVGTLGGALRIESVAGHGTRLTAERDLGGEKS